MGDLPFAKSTVEAVVDGGGPELLSSQVEENKRVVSELQMVLLRWWWRSRGQSHTCLCWVQIYILTICAWLLLISCHTNQHISRCPQHTDHGVGGKSQHHAGKPKPHHGTMMEGFREWFLAGCCVSEAPWGYEPVSQQWGHKCRQTTASAGSVVALTAGNLLDNCSERCGLEPPVGRDWKARNLFHPKVTPNPFCCAPNVCLLFDFLFCCCFFTGKLTLSKPSAQVTTKSSACKVGSAPKKDAQWVYVNVYAPLCYDAICYPVTARNFPGRSPVSFHVQTCLVNHYSTSCSSLLCNVWPMPYILHAIQILLRRQNYSFPYNLS